jgi:hypothetical protein
MQVHRNDAMIRRSLNTALRADIGRDRCRRMNRKEGVAPVVLRDGFEFVTDDAADVGDATFPRRAICPASQRAGEVRKRRPGHCRKGRSLVTRHQLCRGRMSRPTHWRNLPNAIVIRFGYQCQNDPYLQVHNAV